MSFLRPFRTPAVRSALRPSLTTAPRAWTPARFYAAGYGDPEGNPKSEHPKDQGTNPKSHLEHPGPPAPKVGKANQGSEGSSSSSSSQEGSPKSSSTNDAQKGETSGSKKGNAGETEQSGGGNKGKDMKESRDGGAGGKPQPKILSNELPPENEDVKQHNKEMDNRADRADAKAGKQ